MKPHPRIRKTIKWGGAVVTVLLAVVWIWSGWIRFVIYTGSEFGPIGVKHGQIHIGIVTVHSSAVPISPRGYFVIQNQPAPEWRWWFGRSYATARATVSSPVLLYSEQSFIAPLWPFVVASMLACGIACYRDDLFARRARLNLCLSCNYDRAGLAAGAVCPECGQASVPI